MLVPEFDRSTPVKDDASNANTLIRDDGPTAQGALLYVNKHAFRGFHVGLLDMSSTTNPSFAFFLVAASLPVEFLRTSSYTIIITSMTSPYVAGVAAL